jgi:acyl-CoA reductase-like NAD-dependent aldehyde dehydrogenase
MSPTAPTEGAITIPEAPARGRWASAPDLDRAVADVAANAEAWVATSIADRRRLLDQLVRDTTHDAVVFGVGEEGARRKRERAPRITKEVTSELGNVSPVIVVPGPWTEDDLAYQGKHLATMLVNNAGFNCACPRVLVTHRCWGRRRALLESLRASLAEAPQRDAYYPGARQRWEHFRARWPPPS